MYKVKVLKNVVYGKYEREYLTADIYMPIGKKEIPSVICLHGGGWRYGNSLAYAEWGQGLAENGMCAMAVNFRLSTDDYPSWPGVLDDVEQAVNFLVKQAHEWELNPYNMAFMGDSTGAHLAFMATFRHEYASHKIRAIVSAYGVFDVGAWADYAYKRWPDHSNGVVGFLGKDPHSHRVDYEQASPYYTIDHAISNHPLLKLSVMLLWGEKDGYVTCADQSIPFVAKLKEHNIPVEVIPVADAAHLWFPRDIMSNQINPLDQYPLSEIAPRVINFLKTEFEKPLFTTPDFSVEYSKRAAFRITRLK